MTDELLDAILGAVLKASGSALRHHETYTRDWMREALRDALVRRVQSQEAQSVRNVERAVDTPIVSLSRIAEAVRDMRIKGSEPTGIRMSFDAVMSLIRQIDPLYENREYETGMRIFGLQVSTFPGDSPNFSLSCERSGHGLR